MENLFFTSDKPLKEISNTILKNLNIYTTKEGDNSSSLNGSYFEGIILGLAIKIDENNYDYENSYNYMVTIKKAIGTRLNDEVAILGVAEVVASVIASKLNIKVALELELRNLNEKSYSLKVFSFDGEKVTAEIMTFTN